MAALPSSMHQMKPIHSLQVFFAVIIWLVLPKHASSYIKIGVAIFIGHSVTSPSTLAHASLAWYIALMAHSKSPDAVPLQNVTQLLLTYLIASLLQIHENCIHHFILLDRFSANCLITISYCKRHNLSGFPYVPTLMELHQSCSGHKVDMRILYCYCTTSCLC